MVNTMSEEFKQAALDYHEYPAPGKLSVELTRSAETQRDLELAYSPDVFHDDQYSTAIVTLAGLLNALEIQGKSLRKTKIVCLGAGAAAIACCKLMVEAGIPKGNMRMLDSRGVIHSRRSDLNGYKHEFARVTEERTLDDAIEGADVFLGLAGSNLLSAEQIQRMAPRPIIFACSNPDPEIDPDVARKVRDDLVMATGRSDHPNQVNNLLCFPFLFRGALDVRARTINRAMKLAAVEAIRGLAKQPLLQAVSDAYGGIDLSFGPEYILPKPVDPRLLTNVSAAVAAAAVESGVARGPYPTHYPLIP